MGHTLRVVLDTNVLLSGIAFPGSIPGKIMSAWRLGSLEVVLSDFILNELGRVLPRLNHRHGLTSAEIDDLLDILSIQAEVLEPQVTDEQLLRDVNDLPVLGTLLAAVQVGSVNYLITGDKDLLVLRDRYPVISPADFWMRHGGL
ncbi:putative toxin-antitoxin system toxin component, PIN family [Zoogloea sp.]|jgi:putative PIN family toxin of toxin-antitoxin system|uniref:putative toxin-antitoxin system toxin component, PIN family n=1 Tax=Zoogloea sp. TaxID=49181 RepID=UPI001D8E19B2|nr:putative toxin-antitoxin system toxin component, PIN family [Zoogloea sp.]MBK6653830.1 putative toxin-antitoxin system toxin component, PIN family [Zoogloea sp.]HPI61935.1 putative toxin-antitoxin system toxin component, PIN family [Zoogloea sp.]